MLCISKLISITGKPHTLSFKVRGSAVAQQHIAREGLFLEVVRCCTPLPESPPHALHCMKVMPIRTAATCAAVNAACVRVSELSPPVVEGAAVVVSPGSRATGLAMLTTSMT